MQSISLIALSLLNNILEWMKATGLSKTKQVMI